MTIKTGYIPRSGQHELHLQLKRFNVLNAHRRFGKSVFAVNAMLDYLLRCEQKNPSGVYVAMNYASAKRIVWDYVKQFTEKFPGVKTNESELLVTIPRPWKEDKIKIQLLGSERYDSIRGIYIDFCVQDEYAFCMPDSWNKIIRPALADRGGSAILISTPNGRNHFYELYGRAERAMLNGKDWFVKTIKASDSGVLSKDELEEIRDTVGDAAYQQEFECSFFAQVKGAYYKDQLDLLRDKGQIKDFGIDMSLETHVAFDLGIGDSTAMWFFQLLHNEIHVVDYHEDSGKKLGDYVNVIRQKPYVIGQLILPHDAAARELGTGKTRQEMLRDLGMRNTRLLKRQTIEDGINAVRMTLSRCWFHESNCRRGLECLYNYHKEFNDKLQTYNNSPAHDWSSHGCCVAGTQVLMSDGSTKSIETIVSGEYVSTPVGPCLVEWSGETKKAKELVRVTTCNGSVLTVTPEHKFLTNRGLVCADELRYLDGLWIQDEDLKELSSMASFTNYRDDTMSLLRRSGESTATYTELFGLLRMALFLKLITSTIKMAIHLITGWRTWSVFQRLSTCQNMQGKASGWVQMPIRHNLLTLRFLFQSSGMDLRRGGLGILDTQKRVGRKESFSPSSVKNADQNIKHLFRHAQSSATRIVRLQRLDVGGEGQSVYDLTVKDHHCYAANGLLVSNSDAFRYLCLGLRRLESPTSRFSKSLPRQSDSSYDVLGV